jgi:hypothetical protein
MDETTKLLLTIRRALQYDRMLQRVYMCGTKYTYIHLQARVVVYSNIHTRMLILYLITNPSLLIFS